MEERWLTKDVTRIAAVKKLNALKHRARPSAKWLLSERQGTLSGAADHGAASSAIRVQ